MSPTTRHFKRQTEIRAWPEVRGGPKDTALIEQAITDIEQFFPGD